MVIHVDVAITKMSSKGQVVVPSEMREDIGEGEKLIIIRNDHQLIMKKASELGKNLEEDLKFARRTEEAWKRYEKGGFKSASASDFIRKLEKC